MLSNKSFDGRGNYTLGLTEQLIFSEIVYDNVVKVRGMDIVFVTTAKTNDEALDLLKDAILKFPNSDRKDEIKQHAKELNKKIKAN